MQTAANELHEFFLGDLFKKCLSKFFSTSNLVAKTSMKLSRSLGVESFELLFWRVMHQTALLGTLTLAANVAHAALILPMTSYFFNKNG